MNRKFVFASLNILLFIIISILIDFSLYMIHFDSILFIILIQVILTMISIITYFSRKMYIYNIGMFLLFLFNVISCYYLVHIENYYSCLSNVFHNKYEYKEYHLYVLKSTKYHNINDLQLKNIGMIRDHYEYNCEVLNNINEISCISYDEVYSMFDDLNQGNIQGIFLYEDINHLDIISSDYRDIYDITVKYLK